MRRVRSGWSPAAGAVGALGALGVLAGCLPAQPGAPATARIERVTVDQGGGDPDGSSTDPTVSADGRFVAFLSVATDLVPGDTNGMADVFVRDRRKGRTIRVTVGA